MWMNLLVIVIVGALTYLWVTRGFFSALINLVCVITAGALAFAFWESTALFLLAKAPRTGFASFLWQSSWAFGLAIPFGISLALLRAVLDKVLPSNTVLEPAADFAGGGVCGLGAGLITAGIVVMSLGMLRVDRNFLGYARISQQGGNNQSTTKLWVPVDDLVASLYGKASMGVFATDDALALYYPNVADVPEMLRSSEGGGKAMNVMIPASASVVRRYRVGVEGTPLAQLIGPDQFENREQQAADFQGERFPAGSTLQGFTVQFAPSAREKNGQIVIGGTQIRLLVHGADDAGNSVAKDLFPVAAISLAAATPVRYGRWRFDAPNVFISSVGGASETLFTFEFVVPPNFQPVGLYIKGVRYDIDPAGAQFRENGGTAFRAFDSVAERDTRLPNGDLSGQVIAYTPDELDLLNGGGPPPQETVATNGVLTRNSIANFIVQKGTHQGLEIDRNNKIVQGQATFEEGMLQGRGLDRALRINQFQNPAADTAIVQVNVSVDSPNEILLAVDEGARPTDRVQLVDTFGNRYDPVGYIYKERTFVTISYFPGAPITALRDLPELSRSSSQQELYLIYRVSAPTTLASFEVGSVVIQSFMQEPLEVATQQQGR